VEDGHVLFDDDGILAHRRQAIALDGEIGHVDDRAQHTLNRPVVTPDEASALVPWFLRLYHSREFLPIRYKISRGYLKDVMTTIHTDYVRSASLAYGVPMPCENEQYQQQQPQTSSPPSWSSSSSSSTYYPAPVTFEGYAEQQQQQPFVYQQQQQQQQQQPQPLMIEGVAVYPTSGLPPSLPGSATAGPGAAGRFRPQSHRSVRARRGVHHSTRADVQHRWDGRLLASAAV
jgi:hypothetical protein